MVDFKTFEDVLDFAILQEKAAQQFYTKLSAEMRDPEVQLFYQRLVGEEHQHEAKLRELKRFAYELVEPDLAMLKESGYLDAMPIAPEATLREAVQYAIKKEKSARMLYRALEQMCERPELKTLFQELANEEESHASHFQSEYKDLLAT